MKNPLFALGFPISIWILAIAISCTKEQIVIKTVKTVDTITVTKTQLQALDPLTDTLYHQLSGVWNLSDFTITRSKDLLLTVRNMPNYADSAYENIKLALDTLSPDSNMVKRYTMKYFPNQQKLKGVKTYVYSNKIDSIYWEVQLAVNRYSVDQPAALIIEKRSNLQKLEYDYMVYSIQHLDSKHRFIDLLGVYIYNAQPYSLVQYELQFNKSN